MLTIHERTRVIAFGNGRGGGGKTTVTGGIAAYAAHAFPGLRVVALDGDPQSSLSAYLGSQAVTNPLQAAPVDVHGFRLFRGGHALHSSSARDFAAHLQRASADADVLFVDLPPALEHSIHSAVLKHPNTELLIVPQLEPGAIQPAQRLAAMARRRKVPFHLLGNQLDRRRRVTSAVAQGLHGIFPTEMLPIVLPDAAVAMSAILARTPLPLYRPREEISRALGIVARTILRMEGR